MEKLKNMIKKSVNYLINEIESIIIGIINEFDGKKKVKNVDKINIIIYN